MNRQNKTSLRSRDASLITERGVFRTTEVEDWQLSQSYKDSACVSLVFQKHRLLDGVIELNDPTKDLVS